MNGGTTKVSSFPKYGTQSSTALGCACRETPAWNQGLSAPLATNMTDSQGSSSFEGIPNVQGPTQMEVNSSAREAHSSTPFIRIVSR